MLAGLRAAPNIVNEMGVGGLKMVQELRGEDCIGFGDMPQPKQTTMVSQSFGAEVCDYDELANATTMFATDTARSIRRANLVASSVSVFIETNRFDKSPHHAPSHSEALSEDSGVTGPFIRSGFPSALRAPAKPERVKRSCHLVLRTVQEHPRPRPAGCTRSMNPRSVTSWIAHSRSRGCVASVRASATRARSAIAVRMRCYMRNLHI